MSLHIAKLFKNPLTLASAALVLHIGTATAADSTGDIQQQLRELLAGTPTAHSASQPRPLERNATSPTVDSQEFLRQLLGAATPSHVGDAETIKHSEIAGASGETAGKARPGAQADVQAAMRQFLLGRPVTGNASRITARRTR